jgi:hypothetical protein
LQIDRLEGNWLPLRDFVLKNSPGYAAKTVPDPSKKNGTNFKGSAYFICYLEFSLGKFNRKRRGIIFLGSLLQNTDLKELSKHPSFMLLAKMKKMRVICI